LGAISSPAHRLSKDRIVDVVGLRIELDSRILIRIRKCLNYQKRSVNFPVQHAADL